MHAAEQRAKQDGWTVAIAIVDSGGHLLSFSRLPGTQIASIDVAIQKAVTSVYYKRPTKVFQDRLADGNMALLSLPNFSAFEGGVPVVVDGEVIEAIGVSGVTPAEDGIIAAAGVEAFRRFYSQRGLILHVQMAAFISGTENLQFRIFRKFLILVPI